MIEEEIDGGKFRLKWVMRKLPESSINKVCGQIAISIVDLPNSLEIAINCSKLSMMLNDQEMPRDKGMR